MSQKTTISLIACFVALASLANTGCMIGMTSGPNMGFMGVPIPVSPFLQDKQEVKYWNHERY